MKHHIVALTSESELPSRPRSHQLEDLSITYFKSKLPDAWVCREKDRDYGVDLEVEIFDEQGSSTGLMFYVQLKATDDPDKECKASIPVDRIRYLQSFDVPSILVRYCAETKGLFWKWTFGALSKVNADNASVTVLFTEPWDEQTPAELLNVAQKMRRLKAASRNEKFPVAVVQQTSAARALKYRAALSEVLSELPFFSLAPSDPTALELTITFSDDSIRIALEPIGYLEVDSAGDTEAQIIAKLTYGLTSALSRMGFSERAGAAARACLKLDQCDCDLPGELTYIACLALQADPAAAVRLAIQNRLHCSSDWSHFAFLTSLLGSSEKEQDWKDAVERFYQATLEAAREQGKNPGHVLYSLGNFRSSVGYYSKAISAFNAARKAHTKYVETDYFLNELGGALFFRGRYRCAASAYQMSLARTHDKRIAFCLADSLLFAGDYATAIEMFTKVRPKGSDPFEAEARLKLRLANWLAHIAAVDRPTDVKKILSLAEEARNRGAMVDCFFASLLAAFVVHDSEELWALTLNFSMICCSQDELIDVMICADEATGLRAYSILRSTLSGDLSDEGLLADLDSLSLQIHAEVQSRPKQPLTARLHYEDKTEVFVRH